MFKIYCDGACSNNGAVDALGGFAWVLYLDDSRVPFLTGYGKIQNCTNQICELVAATKACEFLQTILAEIDSAEIYVDSAYIYNCYTQNWWRKWVVNGWVNSQRQSVANKEIWQRLIPFFEDPRIKWCKVKGHQGNYGNEYADKLAVAAKTAEIDFFNIKEWKNG